MPGAPQPPAPAHIVIVSPAATPNDLDIYEPAPAPGGFPQQDASGLDPPPPPPPHISTYIDVTPAGTIQLQDLPVGTKFPCWQLL
jgi:hypothetical protein